jgi:lipoprotein-releasing system permease protein
MNGLILPITLAFGVVAAIALLVALLRGRQASWSLVVKYLRKRRIAWVSLIAVMLCTAMVLVVISIMGGWLRMFKESFHGLGGDLVVTSHSLSGFAHYEEIIRRVEALPEIEAAAPTIQTFGLMKINNGRPGAVQVMGYDMDRITRVNDFRKSLYRQYVKPVEEEKKDPAKIPPPSFKLIEDPDEADYDAIAKFRMPKAKNVKNWPGMIVGAGVVGIGKDKTGKVTGRDGLLDASVRLEVLGIKEDMTSLQGATPTPNFYWIVDDSRTQLWQFDAKTVYVPFDVLQKDLGMQQRELENPDTKEKVIEPARTSDINIKVKPGVDLLKAKEKVVAIVADYYPQVLEPDSSIGVETWEESNATWIGAVEKEKGLVTFLFGMISIVAIFLIFCIFYMIVVEKTRDIGIIKSVGSTSAGVAGIFLGYGFAIGVVGAASGLALGWFIVHYINEIHTFMGQHLGIIIWNPEVYAFDTIPNTMNPNEVAVILVVAVIASVLGALVPAVRAAGMHPIDALRWE